MNFILYHFILQLRGFCKISANEGARKHVSTMHSVVSQIKDKLQIGLEGTSTRYTMSIIGNSHRDINSIHRLLIFIALVLKPVINGARCKGVT